MNVESRPSAVLLAFHTRSTLVLADRWRDCGVDIEIRPPVLKSIHSSVETYLLDTEHPRDWRFGLLKRVPEGSRMAVLSGIAFDATVREAQRLEADFCFKKNEHPGVLIEWVKSR